MLLAFWTNHLAGDHNDFVALGMPVPNDPVAIVVANWYVHWIIPRSIVCGPGRGSCTPCSSTPRSTRLPNGGEN